MLVPPPLFLLSREFANCSTPAGCRTVTLGAYAGLALLAPAGAVLVARAVAAGRAPGWLAPRPDDRTLALVGVIVGLLAAYLVASALGAVPAWLDRLLAPVGVLLALPLVVVHAALVGAARSLGSLPEALELGVAAVGVGVSGAWWYVLAKTVAHGLDRVNEPRD